MKFFKKFQAQEIDSLTGLPVYGERQKRPAKPVPHQWSKRNAIIMSLICVTVGWSEYGHFVNVMFKNGGAPFFLAFLIAELLVGIPITCMELSLGQFAGRDFISVWTMCPAAKGLGWAMTLFIFLIAIVRNRYSAYLLYYVIVSIKAELPWSKCYSWMPMNCMIRDKNESYLALCMEEHGADVCNGLHWETAEEVFWKNLYMNNGPISFTNIRWDISICLLFVSFLPVLAIFKGTTSFERVSVICIVCFLSGGTILVGASVLHTRAVEGLSYLISSDFSYLLNINTWVSAVLVSIWSSGIGFGVLILYGSLCPFRNPSNTDSVIVSLTSIASSSSVTLFAFACGGSMSNLHGLAPAYLHEEYLQFMLMPELIYNLPGTTPVWSFLYYLVMLIISYTSEFTLLFALISIIYERIPFTLKYKIQTSILLCLIIFVCDLPLISSAGFYVVKRILYFSHGPMLLLSMSAETLFVFWIYGFNTLADDLHFMHGVKPCSFWRFCWFMSPVLMLISLVYELLSYNELGLTLELELLGWTYFLILVILITVGATITILKYKNRKKKVIEVLRPDMEWGPKDPELIKNRRLFTSDLMTKEYMYRKTRLQAHEKLTQGFNEEEQIT